MAVASEIGYSKQASHISLSSTCKNCMYSILLPSGRQVTLSGMHILYGACVSLPGYHCRDAKMR